MYFGLPETMIFTLTEFKVIFETFKHYFGDLTFFRVNAGSQKAKLAIRPMGYNMLSVPFMYKRNVRHFTPIVCYCVFFSASSPSAIILIRVTQKLIEIF